MPKHLKSCELYVPLMPGTLISDKTVAAVLGVGRTKVWLLAQEGKLVPVKLGNRCTRFHADQVLALINGEVH